MSSETSDDELNVLVSLLLINALVVLRDAHVHRELSLDRCSFVVAPLLTDSQLVSQSCTFFLHP